MHPFYMLYVIEKQALKKMIYGKWIWIHWPNSFLHPVQYPPLKLSLFLHLQLIWGESPLGLLRWVRGKESAFQCRRCKRHELDPWVRKIPWRRKWQPTPVFFPGKPHRQRSLVGYSPRGLQRLKHSWVTEHTQAPQDFSKFSMMTSMANTIKCSWFLEA